VALPLKEIGRLSAWTGLVRYGTQRGANVPDGSGVLDARLFAFKG